MWPTCMSLLELLLTLFIHLDQQDILQMEKRPLSPSVDVKGEEGAGVISMNMQSSHFSHIIYVYLFGDYRNLAKTWLNAYFMLCRFTV